MMRQFLNVVNQTVQIPLRVHLGLRAQGESVQSLVVAQVPKNWLDDGDPAPIKLATPVAVYGLLHALGVAQR